MMIALLVHWAPALTIPRAKADVRAALAAADGQTKDRTVRAAVDALAALNPTVAPARATALLGEWKQINSPEYPGMLGLDDQGNPQYTLGRLAFGIFEPKDLVCSISDVLNPLFAQDKVDNLYGYRIEIPLSFSGESGARVDGTLLNFAECGVLSDDRVSVSFLGGELRPGEGGLSADWEATFGTALESAPRGTSARLVGWLTKRLMGLERPTGMDGDGVMAYQMTKAPEGYLDVMYLDDEWRITKGNRGSIVVAERVA